MGKLSDLATQDVYRRTQACQLTVDACTLATRRRVWCRINSVAHAAIRKRVQAATKEGI